MRVSTNQSTKKTFNTGANPFTSSITRSNNQSTKKIFRMGTNPIEGVNLASSPFGSEGVFGGPFSSFGDGEFGGLSHFKLRTEYTHSH